MHKTNYPAVAAFISGAALAGGICIYLIVRLVRQYDEKFKEIFHEIRIMREIKTDLEWIKKEHDRNHGGRK